LRIIVGPTFGAKYLIEGTREGRAVLHAIDAYPWSALGEVTFLWRPRNSPSSPTNATDVRHIWIWSHPASYAAIFDELKKVFDLTEANARTTVIPKDVASIGRDGADEQLTGGKVSEMVNQHGKDSGGVRGEECRGNLVDVKSSVTDDVKMETETTTTAEDCSVTSKSAAEVIRSSSKSESSAKKKNKDSKLKSKSKLSKNKDNKQDRRGKNKNKNKSAAGLHVISKVDLERTAYDNGTVRLESLKDELCRFRLIGPSAHRIVWHALPIARMPGERESTESVTSEGWWQKYCETDEGKIESKEKLKVWGQAGLEAGDVGKIPSRMMAGDFSSKLQGAAAQMPGQLVHGAGDFGSESGRELPVNDAGEFPPHSVVGLTVRDPRLFLPKTRTPVGSTPLC
jgi:hypothetical protein